jgi:hypothetical protein
MNVSSFGKRVKMRKARRKHIILRTVTSGEVIMTNERRDLAVGAPVHDFRLPRAVAVT